MELPRKLRAVADLVAQENARLEKKDIPGFLPYDPHQLAQALLAAMEHLPAGARSLDLGAGTGAWWLMAAAAGIPSYAIEISPELARCAQRLRAACIRQGLIDPKTPCSLAQGDMIPSRWSGRYASFIRQHAEVARSMPQGDDAYASLGLRLQDAQLIYCWAWPTQSRFLFNMLAAEAAPDALFVLPSYVRYTQGEHMNQTLQEPNELHLEQAARVGDIFIGRKAA